MCTGWLTGKLLILLDPLFSRGKFALEVGQFLGFFLHFWRFRECRMPAKEKKESWTIASGALESVPLVQIIASLSLESGGN